MSADQARGEGCLVGVWVFVVVLFFFTKIIAIYT